MASDWKYLEEYQVISALRNNFGHLGMAATELHITRINLVSYLMEHPNCREELNSIKETHLDDAERELKARIYESDSLLMFYLKTQGKSRGYNTNVSISGPDGESPIALVDAKSLIEAMRNGTMLATNDTELIKENVSAEKDNTES